MTYTVNQVRQALADAITAGTDLRATPIVQDQIVAPIAVVARQAFDPRMVFSQRKAAYQFTVTIYVGRTVERAAQNELDGYAEISGDGSVIAAIQDGTNWVDVTVDYAVVTNVSEVQVAAIGEVQYLAVVLDVEVCW